MVLLYMHDCLDCPLLNVLKYSQTIKSPEAKLDYKYNSKEAVGSLL